MIIGGDKITWCHLSALALGILIFILGLWVFPIILLALGFYYQATMLIWKIIIDSIVPWYYKQDDVTDDVTDITWRTSDKQTIVGHLYSRNHLNMMNIISYSRSNSRSTVINKYPQQLYSMSEFVGTGKNVIEEKLSVVFL